MPNETSFLAVVNAAIRDFEEHGYTSTERLLYWHRRIREAAEQTLVPASAMQEMIIRLFRGLYRKLIDQGQITRFHPGVSKYDLTKLRPELKAELDRRVIASADLIRLNREEMIEKTLRRFSGWATAQPVGGGNQSPSETQDRIKKSIKALPFQERRVLTDQGHKFSAAISDIVATNGGAIAAIWRSHWKQANYDYRDEHKDRELESQKQPYVIRGSWAIEKGFIKTTGVTYTDQITQPGEEVYCRCWYEYIYHLSDLPKSYLTKKGLEAIKVRA